MGQRVQITQSLYDRTASAADPFFDSVCGRPAYSNDTRTGRDRDKREEGDRPEA